MKLRMRKKIIGIVGGVGPYTGLDLNKKIFDLSNAKTDQDYPEVYLLSASGLIVDRSKFLLKQTKINPAEGLLTVIKLLAKIGATEIAIPCNTAHSPTIFRVLEKSLKKEKIEVNLFNIIHETAKYLMKKKIIKVGLLSTKGTYHSKVYENELKKLGIKTILPFKEEQKSIHKAIYSKKIGIKSVQPTLQEAKSIVKSVVISLQKRGLKSIIMGCSEIPLAIEQKETDIFLIDPTKILAKALLKSLKI